MKIRLISMLIASSMAAGNFTMPVSTAALKENAPLMRTGSTEYMLPTVGTDVLTDGSSDYPETENYDFGLADVQQNEATMPDDAAVDAVTSDGLAGADVVFDAPVGGDLSSDGLAGADMIYDAPAGGDLTYGNFADADTFSDAPAGGNLTPDGLAGADAFSDAPSGEDLTSDGLAGADVFSDAPSGGNLTPDSLPDSDAAFDAPTGGDLTLDGRTDADVFSDAPAGGNLASDILPDSEDLSGALSGGDLASDNLADENALSASPEGEDPLNEELTGEELTDESLTDETLTDEDLADEELSDEETETLEEEVVLTEDGLDEENGQDDEEDPEKDDPEEDSEELDEDPEEALGGYEFAGYLDDLIPNFVWVGEGEPSRIGHEYLLGEEKPRGKADGFQGDTDSLSDDDPRSRDRLDIDDESSGETLYGNLQDDGLTEDAPAALLPYTVSADSELTGEPAAMMSYASSPSGYAPLAMTLVSPIMEDELVSMDFDTQSTSNAPMMAPASPSLVGASGGNYIADTVKRVVYQGYKSRSTTVDSSMSDGLHTISSGKVRIYKDGRYFINGGVALDGEVYYADEDGYLIGGWLKTIMDSSNSNYQNEKNDMAFSFRFFDRSSYKMQTGLVKVDGLWHYFNDNGAMIVNKANTINGNYYYSDRYGICEKVKLRFGNVITSDNDQNNNAYLANKTVTAVDINTFTGQNGEYSFRPKWYRGVTSVEVFGFTPVENSEAYYCTLRDGSLAGKIGCIYRNVGKYNGRTIDIRLTVTGYEFFNLNGDTEVGYFYVTKDKIGLNACNTRSITADMEFLDHETGRAVSLKGYATFSDIDISQSVSILSPVDNVYVDKNCALYKDPASMTFTAPFTASRVGSVINDPDREYWVQVNYTGSHLKFRFGSAYEQYVFADSGLNISGEARDIWNKSYSGNPADYSIVHDDGLLYQSWQGFNYRRLGRISIPPVSKTVSDQDEKFVTDNRLKEDELSYFYTLSHNVPAESSEYYYSSYKVSDLFENGLIIQSAGIRVHDDAGADVTERFDVSVSGQRVEFSAKAVFLAHSSFYDNNYHYTVPVTIRDVNLLEHKDGEDRVIYNKCTAGFTRPSGSEEKTSNTTTTRIRIPYSFGDITITKRILEKDIVWAHGNPTFLFSAEGTDEKGVRHRYEEYICFSRGKYSVNSGYAVLSATIRHVPAGVYRVCELPVIDYYLSGAQALTSNMTITNVSNPGRGKDPSQVAYGSCTLTRTNPNAGIAFTNTKGDYHGLRHTSVVQNNIPVAFDTES